MTRFYVVKSERNRSRLEGRHPAGLPGVHCEACGRIWAVTGVEYPTVDAPELRAEMDEPAPVRKDAAASGDDRSSVYSG